MIVIGGGHVAAELVGELGVEADALGGERHVPADGLRDRTRRAERFEAAERGRIRIDQVGETPQDLARSRGAMRAQPLVLNACHAFSTARSTISASASGTEA